MYFLTEIDPRAAVKGSRDPLGLQPIWTRFGRKVVGNLTTVTTSVRNFTTWMLGLYFAEKLIEARKAPEEERVNLFLRFEQLAAYSRYAVESENGTAERILGINRVKKRLDRRERVTISPKQQHQILSNQKTYGIWGLYSVAGAQSGLSDRATGRLSDISRDFVETHYLPKLARAHSTAEPEVLKYIQRDRAFDPDEKEKKLAGALAGILPPNLSAKERDFYAKTLVLADGESEPTNGRQAKLWHTIEAINESGQSAWNRQFDYLELTEVIKGAKESDLAEPLRHIQTIEPLFGAASFLFGFTLERNGARLKEVDAEVRRAWGSGLKHLEPEQVEGLRPLIVEASNNETVDRLVQMTDSLRSGHYDAFIRTATEQNAAVMAQRGGSPWLSIEKGRIHIRLRAENAALPPREALKSLWTNPYFINSLKIVGATVMGRI